MSVAAPDLIAPAFHTVPDHVGSAGAEVADLAAACGFAPDPEQRLYLDGTFAESVAGSDFTGGRWAALESAIICPRQNAKTAALEMSVLGDMFLLKADLVVWTAHRFQTAIEAFLDFKNLIDANAFLSRRVKRITEASGNEGIELMSGQRLKFLARSKSSGRGLTGDVVILDEAFALTAAEMGALLPTLSARPNAQVRYGSSAGLVDSVVLRGIRDRGRDGDPSLFYAEWCVTKPCGDEHCDHAAGTPGCVLDDLEALAEANFAMDRRIPREFIAAERRALPPEEFGRERAGWWDEPRAGSVIPMSRWVPLGRDPRTSRIDGPVCVAVDVTIDRKQSVVAVCGDAGGVPQVEIAAMADGTDWVVERVAAMIDRHSVVAVGARSAGPVASLLPGLRTVCDETQTEFVKIGSGDAAAQCGAFYDAVTSGSLAHLSDTRIDAALTAARKHQVLDAWSWERTRVDTDAAPLVAVTGALALFIQHSKTTEYDPLSNIF